MVRDNLITTFYDNQAVVGKKTTINSKKFDININKGLDQVVWAQIYLKIVPWVLI